MKIKGKRTFLTSLLITGAGIAELLGYPIPAPALTILGGLGLGFLRAGANNVQTPSDPPVLEINHPPHE